MRLFPRLYLELLGIGFNTRRKGDRLASQAIAFAAAVLLQLLPKPYVSRVTDRGGNVLMRDAYFSHLQERFSTIP